MLLKYKEFEPKVHESCFIAPGSKIIGKVIIGKNSSIWHNAVLRGDVDFIEIGENSNVQDSSTLHCSRNIKVKIGNGVTIGHNAILHSCTIDDNALIGMGSILLDGVKIGKNCVIGAGSLVTQNVEIPEGSLAIGSPAKVIRKLSNEEIENLKKSAIEYAKFAKEYIETNT